MSHMLWYLFVFGCMTIGGAMSIGGFWIELRANISLRKRGADLFEGVVFWPGLGLIALGLLCLYATST